MTDHEKAYATYLWELERDIKIYNQLSEWSLDDQSDFLRLQFLLEQERMCSVDSRLYDYLQQGLIPFRPGDYVKSKIDSYITGVFDHYLSIRRSGIFACIKPAYGPTLVVNAEHLILVTPKEWFEHD